MKIFQEFSIGCLAGKIRLGSSASFFVFCSASSSSLLDVLAPRTDIGLSEKEIQAKRKKKGGDKDDPANSNNGGVALNIQHNIYQNLTVKDLANPQTVVRAYKEAESKELQVIFHTC